MTTATLDLHWTQRGLCRLDDTFTPGTIRGGDTKTKDREEQIAAAIKTCRRSCPVLDQCTEWARDQDDLTGQIVAGIYHE